MDPQRYGDVNRVGPYARPVDSERPERLGILGGTFDPVHIGHVVAAVDVRAALGLDRVLMVPGG